MRRTVAEDVPSLVRLVDAVAAEGRWLLVRPGQRTALEEHLLLAQLGSGAGVSLTLEVAGEPLGRAVVVREPDPRGRPAGEVAILLDAAVRGRGLGRALLGQAVAWARAEGLARLRLRVLPDNAPAIGLYRGLGFEDAGLGEHPDRARGRRVQLLTMTLELTGPPGHALVSSPADE